MILRFGCNQILLRKVKTMRTPAKTLSATLVLTACIALNGCSTGYRAGTMENISDDGASGTVTQGITAPDAGGGANTGTSSTEPSAPAAPLAPIVDPGGALPSDGAQDFGPNVLIFDPTMAMSDIQAKISAVFQAQETSQFGEKRYAYLFKPGSYQLDVQLGFYMQVLGLGQSPDDVTIAGALRTTAAWNNGYATTNFWRGAENLSVTPQLNDGTMIWAVSQAAELRRMHIKGPINLWDSNYPSPNWSSGGFIADSKLDATITSGSQQQFLMRNNDIAKWEGGVWNMVFVGNMGSPTEIWPLPPYTVVAETPVIREKPYLIYDSKSSAYSVMVPPLRSNSRSITWGTPAAAAAAAKAIPLTDFYVAHADKDTAETMSIALQRGKHLLLTPGIYHLSRAIEVRRADTVVFGLGKATLQADGGTPAMLVDDVDNVTLAGFILDAGSKESPVLLELGKSKTAVRHDKAPTALYDLSCRVGGAVKGSVKTCVQVNVNDLLMDNVWMWRADHGIGVGWDANPSATGIVVAGDYVTAYGLFVEHFQGYQTVWQGNYGRTYFYQSEIPYDVPSQAAWMHDGVKGYASYKVADTVTNHQAQGMGVYCYFLYTGQLDNAIETPVSSEIKMKHMVMQWLGLDKASGINHLINNQGPAIDANTMSYYSTY